MCLSLAFHVSVCCCLCLFSDTSPLAPPSVETPDDITADVKLEIVDAYTFYPTTEIVLGTPVRLRMYVNTSNGKFYNVNVTFLNNILHVIFPYFTGMSFQYFKDPNRNQIKLTEFKEY